MGKGPLLIVDLDGAGANVGVDNNLALLFTLDG